MDAQDRSGLAARLGQMEPLAAQWTEVILGRHPSLLARFGEAGRRRCTEDGRFHLSFLAGAVQAGQTELFADYIAWTGAMLSSRGVDRAHLAEHLELLAEGLPRALDAAEADFVARFVSAGLDALKRSDAVEEPPPDARTPTRLAYLSAALAGRRAEAYDVARSALSAGWTLSEVYADLLLWGQRRLGELWAAARISVAREHMASAAAQWTMARLSAEIPTPAPNATKWLVAGVEGELHALPASFAADRIQLEGNDVTYLGTHVPSSAIMLALRECRPDVLGLSVTMLFNLPRTVALVREVRAERPDLKIVLGGRAVRGAKALAAELGVELAD